VIPTEQALDRLRLLFREELRSALEETRRAAVLAEREACVALASGHSSGHACDCTERTAREIADAISRRPPP
jgi:hypothetical protein